MTIHDIKGILSSYFSEKGLDSLSSKVRDLLDRKKIKDNISDEIKRALSDFENAYRNEEFVFQGLIELVKGFDDKDFLIAYTIAFSEPDKLEKAKEQIFDLCIRDTHANTPDAKSKVKHILDNCFSIVEESLKSKINDNDWIQTGLINKHADENTKKIIENSNQNTKICLEGVQDSTKEIKEFLSSIVSTTLQPVCPLPTNDNQAYLDAFTNPLFLEEEEEDENIISLVDMYISPSIKDKDIKASECVKKWYNTKTKPCLLLYGNAGVGKSSFVSKILADAYKVTPDNKVEFTFDKDEVMAVALRNHTNKIDNKLTAKEILTTLFSCDPIDQLKDKLIILDGLDELCVLRQEFNKQSFLRKLSQLEYGFHILVTSRESEINYLAPQNEEGLKTERLIWKEKEINAWLGLYKSKKPNKESWCTKFCEQFSSLKRDDMRREIFCVPMILYICGTCETDLENHSSVGSIYRDAFSKILLRKHIRCQNKMSELTSADKEANMIAWQYTKELAYQMFLVGSLDLIDDDNSKDRRAIGFRNAKKRTAYILKEKYKIETPDLELKRELAVCPFANGNEHGGITFAHKTVYEYFTAVKIYEDYFAELDSEFFEREDNDDIVAKEVMERFIEAFRYDSFKVDVFNHLCKMNGEPFSTTLEFSNTKGLNYEKFEQSFIRGMKNHTYAKISLKAAVNEYLYPDSYTNPQDNIPVDFWINKSLLCQISTAFTNLTWLLTGHGFKNKEKTPECNDILKFMHYSLNNVRAEGWYLKGADCEGINLDSANFQGAIVSNACFDYANLEDVIFDDADLTGTFLRNAKMIFASLNRTNLKNADLSGADLTYASFIGTDLRETNLFNAVLDEAAYCTDPNALTLFPDNFDPIDENMVEVNIDGNPI